MRILVLGILSILLTQCRTIGGASKPFMEPLVKHMESPQEITTHAPWTKYVAELDAGYPMQPSCRPASFKHEGELQGVAILFHGYTACPQQFFYLAQELQRRGYDVLVPLIIGHGMKRGLATPEQDPLPTKDNFEAAYGGFVRRMNAIVKDYPAPTKVVGGLSLGGALATGALVYDPELYQRGLIIAPLYRMSPFFADVVGTIKDLDDIVQKLRPEATNSLTRKILRLPVGWGASCDKDFEAGRDGLCNFNVTHLVASQQYGYNLSEASAINNRVQFLDVEGDTVVDVERVLQYYEKQVQSPPEAKSICFYPKGVPHSLVSRYENPGIEKYWMAAFEADATAFLTSGTSFSTIDRKINGYRQCAVSIAPAVAPPG